MSKLWIIATPIGNLEDLGARAARILLELPIIACEDTRHSSILLKKIGAKPTLLRYDEHSHRKALEKIQSYLEKGTDVGLISDAGTPGMSDPGARLVAEIAQLGYQISPIPGPSALTAALSICGFTGRQFHFLGFLPARATARKNLLESLSDEEGMIIFYESPLRINKTLEEIAKTLGNRQAVICRELTKLHETIYRISLANSEAIAELPAKGEYVVIIKENEEIPTKKETKKVLIEIAAKWAGDLVTEGYPKRLAAQITAKKYKISANLIYRSLIPQ